MCAERIKRLRGICRVHSHGRGGGELVQLRVRVWYSGGGERLRVGILRGCDTVGDSSFTYTQKGYGGTFESAIVEIVQVSYLVTMVLDGPNLGTNPPASELAPLVQTSVSRLSAATG
jgi:hypothetical protein